MSDEDPLTVIERFGKAWADHDLDAALDMCTDSCVFESTGPSPDGERYVGPQAIRQAWQPIFDDATSRFDVEETFVSAGNRVVQRWRYSWATGQVRGVDLFEVEGGKIAQKASYVKG